MGVGRGNSDVPACCVWRTGDEEYGLEIDIINVGGINTALPRLTGNIGRIGRGGNGGGVRIMYLPGLNSVDCLFLASRHEGSTY